MKRLILLAVLLSPGIGLAQGVRYQNIVLSSGGFPFPQVRICTEPATGTPCSPLASVYSDAALTVPLPNPFIGDATGNFYFYASTASKYHVQISGTGILTAEIPDISLGAGGGGSGTVTSVATGAGLTGGPITGAGTISIPSAGVTNSMLQNNSITINVAGGITGGGAVALGGTTTITGPTLPSNQQYGLDATLQAGADPCVKIQAAIYSLAATGGIVNATRFTSIPACSINPFQALSQSNPLVFTSLPATGVLLLPDLAFPTDVPWFVPNKWTVIGVGGYGTNRTVVQPSSTFRTNRPVLSATGGATGCTASGTQTITINGTSIATPANLIGMMLFCSSNVSATAVPTPKNAQIGGIITAVSGSGPYLLTISGAGAPGNVTNTGWTINPVIAGWSPTSVVFGSDINQLTVSCTTPAATNVTGCIGFIDLTANEHTTLSNFTVLNYDYIGIGVFTSQSQNGGPFGPITLNSATTGNNNTIGIEIGGSGWNASGGGGTGLCATGNPCSGSPNRGFFGVTDVGSGTGANDGGIGFDINTSGLRVSDSHCESLAICAFVGDSAVATNVEINNVTGCTSAGCAVTSIVDISASYATGSAPAPTQNITVKNILRAFSSTWNIRDLISLTGVTNDPQLAAYTLGANGTAGRMVFTSSQQMSCITTGGAADSNGSHCAPNSQIQVISKMAGTYFADAWNNNGTADICLQINNTMQWVFTVAGITSGAVFDATGFNRNSAYPCATNPFAGGAGTLIPASGILKIGAAKYSSSVQWTVPANWILQGMGGSGLGAGGASGSLISPNINNTANANYGNDTVAGTVTTTAGSYSVTGSGSSWTSALIGHYFMACATLPCTNQALMTAGIVTAVGSGTTLTLDVPAQASVVAGGAYTITAPLVQNSGVIRDVAIDGNSYGTGGGNGNGGFVGVFENGGSSSYVDNMTIGHVNGIGIAASGLLNGTLTRVSITGNAVASSVFACVTAPQGINIDGFACQSNTTPTPTLSYGIMASGSGFSMSRLFFQNVKVGIELAVNPNFATNNVTVTNAASGSGASAVTTLVDLGTVSSGGNGSLFESVLIGLQCPSGCTNIVVDALDSNTLNGDTVLGYYMVSRANGGGNRTVITDSITAGINNIQTAGGARFGGPGSGAGLAGLTQGADNSSLCLANTVCDEAPTAVTTYTNTRPGTAAQGVVAGTLSGAIIKQGFSGDSNHSAVVTTGSGTSITSTSLCSTAFCPAGTYQINSYLDITTACGTSGTYSVSIVFTDDTTVSKTYVMPMQGPGEAAGVLTTTATTNFGQGSIIVRSTGTASINYLTTAVACGSAGPMVGKLYLSVLAVQ